VPATERARRPGESPRAHRHELLAYRIIQNKRQAEGEACSGRHAKAREAEGQVA